MKDKELKEFTRQLRESLRELMAEHPDPDIAIDWLAMAGMSGGILEPDESMEWVDMAVDALVGFGQTNYFKLLDFQTYAKGMTVPDDPEIRRDYIRRSTELLSNRVALEQAWLAAKKITKNRPDLAKKTAEIEDKIKGILGDLDQAVRVDSTAFMYLAGIAEFGGWDLGHMFTGPWWDYIQSAWKAMKKRSETIPVENLLQEFVKNWHPAPGMLHDYLLDELTDADRKKVSDHLNRCPICSQILENNRKKLSDPWWKTLPEDLREALYQKVRSVDAFIKGMTRGLKPAMAMAAAAPIILNPADGEDGEYGPLLPMPDGILMDEQAVTLVDDETLTIKYTVGADRPMLMAVGVKTKELIVMDVDVLGPDGKSLLIGEPEFYGEQCILAVDPALLTGKTKNKVRGSIVVVLSGQDPMVLIIPE